MSTVTTETPIPGAAVVRLARPDRLNALNLELVTDLLTTLDAVEADPECRVVVLTGEGRAFSAGLDLGGYGDDERVAARGPMLSTFERQREIASVAQRLHGLRQPVISAVNGPAAGGGLALVCASDIRIAATDAVFAVSFIKAGYSACDIGVSWLLPRLVGVGRAHELMLTGRRFDATEALRMGLVTEVVEPDRLLEAALAKAQEILLNAPASVELTKVGMWAAVESTGFDATVEFENRQQMVAAMTEDAQEATRAFLEKRPPRWTGR